MSKDQKTNIRAFNDGFSGVLTANKTNKSVERGFSEISTANSQNISNVKEKGFSGVSDANKQNNDNSSSKEKNS